MTVSQAHAVSGSAQSPSGTVDPVVNPVDEVNHFFEQAARRLELSDGCREMLKRPWRELQVQVPVRMDDGEIRVLYRVPGTTQRGQGPLQGRRALPSQRGPRRSACSGLSDDLEDGIGEHPLWWRQRRGAVRPQGPVCGRAKPSDPAVHHQYQPPSGAPAGHTRAGHGHQRSKPWPG